MASIPPRIQPWRWICYVALWPSLSTEFSASHPNAWDHPLPVEREAEWKKWYHSLRALGEIKVPRSYGTEALKYSARIERHTFCDALEVASKAVLYLRIVHNTCQVQVAFVLGKAKLTPAHATTIPPLELCAAVLGVEMTDLAHKELEQKPYLVTYYSDSKVVLGYISNESCRFYVYISNCVERIRRLSAPHQWKYLATNLNPADLATRSIEASKLKESTWHRGPKFLNNSLTTVTDDRDTDAEIFSDDPEVRKDLNVSATHVEVCSTIGSERFSRFSEWSKLQGAIAKLITFACMSTRAIHIEIIESMDTSSFINALRPFLAIRGPVIQLCSDGGTNFVGARNKLHAVLKPSNTSPVKRYLLKEGFE